MSAMSVNCCKSYYIGSETILLTSCYYLETNTKVSFKYKDNAQTLFLK